MFKRFSEILDTVVDEAVAGAGGGGELGKEEMIDFLNADDEDKETLELPKPKKEEKEKEDEGEEGKEEGEEGEEKPDELEELEDELNPPTEEQLELVTPVRRREILAKYPTLFKDFPYLEKAYYREQQFTELLPTIEDAKIAVEKAQTLDNFERDVVQGGNTENILKAVREENPRAFFKIVDDYLPTLMRVDEKAYMHVIGNVTKHTIMAMAREAQRSDNDVLKSAAQILNQFVFGSSDFTPPTRLTPQPRPGEENKIDEVKQREQAFVKQQFETTVGDLNTRVNNTLKNTIEANIDPRKSMTEFVRRHASNEALEELNRLISQDSRFKVLADKLWEKCIEENFSKVSVDRIKSAYLSKSKTLLPSVIKKARNEALRGMGRKVNDNIEEESTPNKSPVTPGRPRSQQPSGKIRDAKDIPKGMKTIDFLNSD